MARSHLELHAELHVPCGWCAGGVARWRGAGGVLAPRSACLLPSPEPPPLLLFALLFLGNYSAIVYCYSNAASGKTGSSRRHRMMQ